MERLGVAQTRLYRRRCFGSVRMRLRACVEAGFGEVVIERERVVDLALAHDDEAHVVDERGAAAQIGKVRLDGGGVEVGIDPGDVEERHDVLQEASRGIGAMATVDEGLRFDDHIVVRHARALGEDRCHRLDSVGVACRVAIEKREQRRRIDEGHRSAR
jgi:hypothetical protein